MYSFLLVEYIDGLLYRSNEMTVRVLEASLREMRTTTIRKEGG